MKKNLRIAGILLLASSMYTSCTLDNEEPAGIEALRGAKSEYFKAEAAYKLAEAEVEKAAAAFKLAQADIEKAKAAEQELKNATRELENKRYELETKYELQKDSLKVAGNAAKLADLEAQYAANKYRYDRIIQENKDSMAVAAAENLADLQKQATNLLIAQEAYRAQLRAIENALTAADSTYLGKVSSLHKKINTNRTAYNTEINSIIDAEKEIAKYNSMSLDSAVLASKLAYNVTVAEKAIEAKEEELAYYEKYNGVGAEDAKTKLDDIEKDINDAVAAYNVKLADYRDLKGKKAEAEANETAFEAKNGAAEVATYKVTKSHKVTVPALLQEDFISKLKLKGDAQVEKTVADDGSTTYALKDGSYTWEFDATDAKIINESNTAELKDSMDTYFDAVYKTLGTYNVPEKDGNLDFDAYNATLDTLKDYKTLEGEVKTAEDSLAVAKKELADMKAGTGSVIKAAKVAVETSKAKFDAKASVYTTAYNKFAPLYAAYENAKILSDKQKDAFDKLVTPTKADTVVLFDAYIAELKAKQSLDTVTVKDSYQGYSLIDTLKTYDYFVSFNIKTYRDLDYGLESKSPYANVCNAHKELYGGTAIPALDEIKEIESYLDWTNTGTSYVGVIGAYYTAQKDYDKILEGIKDLESKVRLRETKLATAEKKLQDAKDKVAKYDMWVALYKDAKAAKTKYADEYLALVATETANTEAETAMKNAEGGSVALKTAMDLLEIDVEVDPKNDNPDIKVEFEDSTVSVPGADPDNNVEIKITGLGSKIDDIKLNAMVDVYNALVADVVSSDFEDKIAKIKEALEIGDASNKQSSLKQKLADAQEALENLKTIGYSYDNGTDYVSDLIEKEKQKIEVAEAKKAQLEVIYTALVAEVNRILALISTEPEVVE